MHDAPSMIRARLNAHLAPLRYLSYGRPMGLSPITIVLDLHMKLSFK